MVGSFSNSGNLGFGVAFVLEDYFSNTANEIERRMGSLGVASDQLSTMVNNSMNQMKLGVTALAIGLGMLLPFYRGAQLQAQFEADTVALQTLLGSAQEAANVFNSIKKEAAVTPFQTKDLLQANIALISQGVAAERSQRMVHNLGNALSAVGRGSEEMMRMAINLQGIAANGATSMDIKQFGYAGINIMKLYADAVGKSTAELKGHKMTLEDIEMALEHASSAGGIYAGAMDRMSRSVQGKISTLKDNVQFSLASIGKSVEPLTHQLLDFFIMLTQKIQDFAATPLGTAVFRIIAALGLFLVVGGLALLLMGGMKFMAYQAAGAFTAKTKAIIIDTIATQGLTAGMWQMAKATWAAIAPMLPYIAILAAVALVIYGVYKAVQIGSSKLAEMDKIVGEGQKSLEDYIKTLTPLERFFTKFTAIINAIAEVWSSWNGDTFTISKSLADKLQALGLLDFVLNLATWIIRIKSFLGGLFEGISEGFSLVWRILKGAGSLINDMVIQPIIKGLSMIGINIGKNTTEWEKWAAVGKVVGYILVGILTAIAVQMVITAASAVIAFWPVYLILAIIALVIYGIIQLIEHWGEIWDWLKTKTAEFLSFIVEGFMDIVDWLVSLPKAAYDAGVNFVTSLWEGIKSVWGEFVAWIDKKLSETPILAQIYGLGKAVYHTATGDFGAAAQDVNDVVNSVTPGGGNYSRSPVFDTMARNRANGGITNNNFAVAPVDQVGGPLHLTLLMDGDKVAQKVVDLNDFKNARKAE